MDSTKEQELLRFLSYFPGYTLKTLDDKAAKEAVPKRKEISGVPRLKAIEKESYYNKLQLNQLEDLNKQFAGVYFTPNNFAGYPRQAEYCQGINAWFMEIDGMSKDEQIELIERSPLKPSLVVETANSLHTYWLAKDAKLDNWKEIIERIINFFDSDPACSDVSRILRLPNFYHHKQTPFLCEWLIDSPERKYTDEEMLNAFPKVEKKIEHTPAYETPPRSSQDSFWEVLAQFPSKDMLLRLSGSKIANFETFSFEPRSGGGEHILVNGEPSDAWLDKNGMIGSGKKGGPTYLQWLRYYGNEWKDIANWMKENCADLIPEHILNPKEQEEEDYTWMTFGELIDKSSKELSEIKKEDVLSYGFNFLDNKLGGIFPGELVLVGGTTGTGKSTFVSLVARNASLKNKVCFIALEDRLEDYGMKVLYYEICKSKKYPWLAYRRNEIWDRVFLETKEKAKNSLKQYQIDFLKTDKIANIEMIEKAIEDKAKEGIKLFILDHLHMFSMGALSVSKEREIEEMMKHLVSLKKRLNISIILVAHFRKIKESDDPTMSDFKDAMAIPQMANTILMLARDRSKADIDEDYSQRTTKFICPKTRGGMSEFTAETKFNKDTGTYEDFGTYAGTYKNEAELIF